MYPTGILPFLTVHSPPRLHVERMLLDLLLAQKDPLPPLVVEYYVVVELDVVVELVLVAEQHPYFPLPQEIFLYRNLMIYH